MTSAITRPGRHGRARVRGRGWSAALPDKLWNSDKHCMPARTCEPGCRKKTILIFALCRPSCLPEERWPNPCDAGTRAPPD